MAKPYDPNIDWVEPKKVYLDDADVVHPELGPCKAWQALIWEGVKHKKLLEARADSATRTPLKDEARPPPLAADTAKIADAVAAAKRRKHYQAMLDKCDELESRCDALLAKDIAKKAARRWADAAMAEAEERYTSPPSEADVDGMTMN